MKLVHLLRLCGIALEVVAEEPVFEVAASALNVRAEPSLDAPVVGKLPRGTRATVEFQPWVTPWVAVSENGSRKQIGFVHSHYLRFTGESGFTFAEVPLRDDSLEIRGKFSFGLPIVLLTQGQSQAYHGTTGEETEVEGWYDRGPEPVTGIVLPGQARMPDGAALAIVGKQVDYSPAKLTMISNEAVLEDLDKRGRASEDVPEREGTEGSNRLTRAWTTTVLGRDYEWLEYTLPYGGDDAPDERLYLLLSGAHVQSFYVEAGPEPLLFTVNGRFFVSYFYQRSESGGRFRAVFEIGMAENKRLVYENSDFSD